METTMNNVRRSPLPPLLFAFGLMGCDDVGTDPGFDELTPDQQLELSVLEDAGSFDAVVEMTSINASVASTLGNTGSSEATSLNAQAGAAFEDARAAHQAGDHQGALDASRIARRLVARALIATGGVPAVEDLLERLEDLLLTMDAEVVDDPDALRAELETILAEATALLDSGDSVGAAARAILGEQRVRLRRGRHLRDFDVGEERARIEVAFASTAITLAERLLVDDVVPDVAVSDVAVTDVANRRNRWLMQARRWLDVAQTALGKERYARAVHAAWHAQFSALKAVILPGGVTAEEIRAIHELAVELFGQAEASLPDDATQLQLRVLNRAADLIEIGVRKLESGHKRGVAALWRSSTMSSWLIS
jgi:uncharacterized protein (UPF0332 family)